MPSARCRNSGSAGLRERDRIEFQQLRIVVEHLLEMRHEPALVDGIAGKAAADLIVDAAERHPLEASAGTVAVRDPRPAAGGHSAEMNSRIGGLGNFGAP